MTFASARRRTHQLSLLSIVATATLATTVWSFDDSSTSVRRINADVHYLASDELEGRGIGTKGIDLAADYVRQQFINAGLKPAFPDGQFFQSFDMMAGRRMGKPNELVVHGPSGDVRSLAIEKDFIPLVFSGSGKYEAPIAFVGFGITAPEYKYDDYATTDVKGSIVIALRGEPHAGDSDDPHAPFAGNADTVHAGLRQKVDNAIKHGAAGVLFVTVDVSAKDQPDSLLAFGYASANPSAKVPVLHITRGVADTIVKSATGKRLVDFESAINSDLKPRSIPLDGVSCRGEVQVEKYHVNVKNVVGVLDGVGASAEETIVVGAHYDHLGLGGEGSLAPDSKQVHNGADDNASGTAGVLELARRLAAREAPLGRRVVFAAFTAEESGLVGSRHYVENPPVPMTQTVAMINFDMIGRLRENKLIVYGVGTATEFGSLVSELGKSRNFSIRPIQAGAGPSDQTSFVRMKVPVLHFFTDNHPDYHKPSDDSDKVSIEGTERVVNLSEELIVSLANAPMRPTYVDIPEVAPGGAAGERAYLGSIPAFGVDVEGVLLDGVSTGSPADKAGLRARDVIIQIGSSEIRNLQDMQDALTRHKPGDVVNIVVLRDKVRTTVRVTLSRRGG